jgi:formamidase
VRFAVDSTRPLAEEPGTGHNRWHPEIAPLVAVEPGETITLETRDGIDGQLGRGSTADDVRRLDLGLGHPLTGPVEVAGAGPGDVLEVELVDFESVDVGVTAVIPGFGFLADEFPDPYVVLWEISDGRATAAELPGVAVPADMFPGVIGVAPSHGLMAEMRRREEELRADGGPVADDLPDRAVPALAAGGLRTIPPRETGGNMDVRQLAAGSRVFFPVHVPGARFSIGDLHFAQGDGEVCGTAIEVAGAATLRFSLHRQPAWRGRFPWSETPPRPGRAAFVTTGLPLAPDGANEPMNLTLCARNALLEMISYLVAVRGLTREAAYVLASATVDLRISQVVDVPNPVVAAVLPLDIFEP